MASPVPSRVRSMRSKRKRSTSSRDEPGPSKIPKASWNDFTTKSLLEVMIGEIHAGNTLNGNINPDGWRNIVRKFGLRTGLPYTKVQLRNRVSVIRKLYAKWRKLNNRATGLGFDLKTGAIVMNDQWWEEMSKEDPEIIKWKSAPPKFLDLMTDCFASGVATGKHTYYPSYCKGDGTFPLLPRPAPPVMATASVPPLSIGDGGVVESNDVAPDATSPLSCGNTTRSKQNRFGTLKTSTGDRMCSSMERCVEMKKKNEILALLVSEKEECKEIDQECKEIDRAMSLVHKIEGLDINSQFYIDAMKVIYNGTKRHLFLNYVVHMNHDMQIKWFNQFIYL